MNKFPGDWIAVFFSRVIVYRSFVSRAFSAWIIDRLKIDISLIPILSYVKQRSAKYPSAKCPTISKRIIMHYENNRLNIERKRTSLDQSEAKIGSIETNWPDPFTHCSLRARSVHLTLSRVDAYCSASITRAYFALGFSTRDGTTRWKR